MKITVVGIGYVGLSNAILLAQHNEVTALDVDENKVDLLNKKISPIEDKEIDLFLKKKKLNITATVDKSIAYGEADYDTLLDLDEFKEICDIVVANRVTDEISDIAKKIYSRDIFNSD